jgi:hypothetical protein
MARRFLVLALLLTIGTACPHTWGKEGYVQKTLHKNIIKDALVHRSCRMTPEEWLLKCADEVDHSGSCPPECPLSDEVDEDW